MNLDFQRRVDHLLGTILIGLFRLPVILLGILLKRDHSLKLGKHLVIIKIRGGGSLMVALPSLLALRREYPKVRMTLVCSSEVVPFAKMLNCFDDFSVVDTSRPIGLILSSARAIKQCWKCDTVADLEIHSKLTTLFSLFLCARNRFGFYMVWNKWKDGLTTHSLFYNESSPVYQNYEHVAVTLGAKPLGMEESSSHLRAGLSLPNCKVVKTPATGSLEICLAPFTTELGAEREFNPEEWAQIIYKYFNAGNIQLRIHLLGGPSEVARGRNFELRLLHAIKNISPALSVEVANEVGTRKLDEVARLMDEVGWLFSVDGGLNHIARLLKIKTTTYWGPTDPYRRLKPFKGLEEEAFYRKIFCSPCVHVVRTPPCGGENLCMKQHLGQDVSDILSRGWLVSKGKPHD